MANIQNFLTDNMLSNLESAASLAIQAWRGSEGVGW